MPELPITPRLDEIATTLDLHKRLVLVAQPGAGKSTQVPLALLTRPEYAQQTIVMLEPRRVAAKALASYLATSLGEQVGQTVGYQIRNEKRVSQNTRLLIVTEGILTRKIQHDPELSGIGCVIFDEFHERSLSADLGLLLAKEIQSGLREDLALLVMSATMDTVRISDYLEHAPIIECEGRSFPVAIEHLPTPSHVPEAVWVGQCIAKALAQCERDILVFLSGQSEILRVCEWCERELGELAQWLPLYGAQSMQLQQRILAPAAAAENTGKRRVILATNIAETSLTIPNIQCVIDTGLVKTSQFDVRSGLTRLVTGMISQASATQRAGRAGRQAAGLCWRLWPAKQALMPFSELEIARSDITDMILELTAWGYTDGQAIPWLDAPPAAHLQYAQQQHQQFATIDPQGKITSHGQAVLAYGIETAHAHLLIAAAKCSAEVLSAGIIIVSLLGERDILPSPDSVDIRLRIDMVLTALQGHKPARSHHAALRSVLQQVRQIARNMDVNIPTHLADEAIVEACLLGFATRIAKQTQAGYTMAMGKGVYLPPEDPLAKVRWQVILDCDAQQQRGRIYLSMPLPTAGWQDALPVNQKLVTDYQHGKLQVKQQTRFGTLILSEQVVTEPDPIQYQAALVSLVQAQGLAFLRWDDACAQWLARVTWLGSHDDAFPVLNETQLLADIETWLFAYQEHTISVKALQHIPLLPLLQATLDYEAQQLLNKYAPTHYVAQSGKRFIITYSQQHAPTVSLPLQAVMGEVSSPILANGRVPLRFELLSPARRPIQTTQDLAGFWQSSYLEVAKEMRGRYPKHNWDLPK
jgi:ATP-dependent helicase HrpB